MFYWHHLIVIVKCIFCDRQMYGSDEMEEMDNERLFVLIKQKGLQQGWTQCSLELNIHEFCIEKIYISLTF